MVGDLLGGGGGGGGLVGIDNGSPGDNNLINLGVGPGDEVPSNVFGLNIGGDSRVATARVGTGNGVGADIGILNNTARGSIGVLNDDGLLALDLDIAGLGINVGVGRPNGPGGPGGPGGSGVGGGGAAASALLALARANCSVNEGRKILKIASDGKFSNRTAAQWRRFANVQIVPIRICAEARRQVAQILRQSGKVNALQDAAARDPLIAASLDRSNRSAGQVVAVAASRGNLTVFVY